MPYALTNGAGKIIGFTQWPNAESSRLVDERSPEWLAFLDTQKPPTPEQQLDTNIISNPVFKALLDELEVRFPGFLTALRLRL